MSECWLAEFSDAPCDGRPERCHLVREQTIRKKVTRTFGRKRLRGAEREAELAVIWDPAVWRWACSFHHYLFDHYRLPVPVSRVPAETAGWLMFYGLSLDGDRRYGP